MRYISLTIALSILIVFVANAEEEPFYYQLNRLVVRLEHFEATQQEGSTNVIQSNIPDGTGFFVVSSNQLFLVSARHVVEKTYDLRSRVECKNLKTGKPEIIMLKIPRNSWIFHPMEGDNDTHYVDVAAVRLHPILDRSIFYFLYEDKDSKEHKQNQLPLVDATPPQPVLVFGFPADIGFQLLEQRPMGRAGIISMKTDKEFLKINDTKFAEERCCLVDAPMFPGNSGSPVMNEPRFTDLKPRLLGVIIASNSRMDFGIMEPVSRIREVLEKTINQPMAGNWELITQ